MALGVGDVVMLTTETGPIMAVESFHDDGTVTCVWWERIQGQKVVFRDSFIEATIKPYGRLRARTAGR